jgi:hypothetical protein
MDKNIKLEEQKRTDKEKNVYSKLILIFIISIVILFIILIIFRRINN